MKTWWRNLSPAERVAAKVGATIAVAVILVALVNVGLNRQMARFAAARDLRLVERQKEYGIRQEEVRGKQEEVRRAQQQEAVEKFPERRIEIARLLEQLKAGVNARDYALMRQTTSALDAMLGPLLSSELAKTKDVIAFREDYEFWRARALSMIVVDSEAPPPSTAVRSAPDSRYVRPNDLEELCKDLRFYQGKVIAAARVGDTEEAAEQRIRLRRVENWIAEYPGAVCP